MKVYEIDGARFSTLDQFYGEIIRVFGFPDWIGRNLNAGNPALLVVRRASTVGVLAREVARHFCSADTPVREKLRS